MLFKKLKVAVVSLVLTSVMLNSPLMALTQTEINGYMGSVSWPALDAAGNNFSFVVVGCAHIGSGENSKGTVNSRKAVSQINAMDPLPAFTCFVGDVCGMKGEPGPNDRMAIELAYPEKLNSVTILECGNHDVWMQGNPAPDPYADWVDAQKRALEDTGKLENTLIIFTSDHGEGLARHKKTMKRSLLDDASKVPLIISWKSVLPEGRIEENELISGLDFFPTVCDYWDVKCPEQVKGKSIRALLEKKAKNLDRQYIAIENYPGMGQAIRSRQYKYIFFKDGTELLFDMKKDPGETKNLVSLPEYRDVLDTHRSYHKKWTDKLEIAPCVPKDFHHKK